MNTFFTNESAAAACDVPLSTWNWYRRRGVIPLGAVKFGSRLGYTAEQLDEIKANIERVGYTKGFVGRKKGTSRSRFETY